MIHFCFIEPPKEQSAVKSQIRSTLIEFLQNACTFDNLTPLNAEIYALTDNLFNLLITRWDNVEELAKKFVVPT